MRSVPLLLVLGCFGSATIASAQVPPVGATRDVGVDCQCPGQPITHHPAGTSCLAVCVKFQKPPTTPSSSQTGWVCPICGLVSHGGTEASLRTHICATHPHVSGCGSSVGTPYSSANSTAVVVGSAALGIVSALSSYFEQRAKEMELSAIQRQYVEESRRQAAEALERQRLQRQRQFERDKQGVLDRMKGAKPADLQMKGAGASALQMKNLSDSAAAAGAAQAAERVRSRVEQLRRDLAISDDGLLKFQRDNIDYRNARPDAEPVLSPMLSGPAVVRTADAVLVGGTGWVYGYNVPPGQGQLAATAQRDLDKQLSLAGVSRDQFTNPADYNLIIGVAAEQDNFVDLVNRVVLGRQTGLGDQFTDGSFSADAQPLYASLRGTQTSHLDCHSNGAMVCLAAISRGDVIATDVRLFGPQITPTALAKWESLLETRKIASLEINVTRGDPIAPASYAFGEAPKSFAAAEIARLVKAGGTVSKLDVFLPDAAEKLKTQIERAAPAVHVNILNDAACREQISSDTFACHNMALYQKLAGRR